MIPTGNQPEKNRAQYAVNIALAAVAGQVGCLTSLIIIIALIFGLWLDNRFDSRPLFTIALLASSVPFTLIGMVWVVRKATSKITIVKRTNSKGHNQEIIDRETNA